MSDQLSFADGFLHPGTGANARLDAIASSIDWGFLEAAVAPLRGGRTGRPPYDPAVMTKALLLAALYDLSDPALEAHLADRLSFRRFCGLALDAPTPDETTLCRFRALCAEHDLMGRAALRAAGIKDRIAHRRHKTVASLGRRRKLWNRAVARRRAPVEAVFSAGKRLYGLGRAGCHSLTRNAQRLIAFILAYNLRRATIIAAP